MSDISPFLISLALLDSFPPGEAFKYSAEQQAVFLPGDPALIGLNIHQHDIRPDPADTVPGDHIIVLPAPKAKHLAPTRHDDGKDMSLGDLHLGIADKAQPPPVIDADHLFAVQLCKPDGHAHSSPDFFTAYAPSKRNIQF